MKLIRISALLLVLLLTLAVFAGCSGDRYKDDCPAEVITSSIVKEIPVSAGYLSYGSDFMQFYLTDAVTPVDDYSVVYSSAADNYNEIGILHVKDKKDLETVENAVSAYLAEFRSTYEQQAQLYDKTEQEKLEDASYTVYGKYVVYMILTDADQKTCDGVIEKLLKIEETT